MKLRTRLLLAVFAVVAVLLVSSVALVVSQRNYLTSQVDRQLESARPIVVNLASGTPTPSPSANGPRWESVSDLFIGQLSESGELSTLMAGQLVEDLPDLRAEDIRTTPFTVGGMDDSHRFRVLAVPAENDGGWVVIAIPLDVVDDAVQRLMLTLVAVALVISFALAIAAWWVIQLGLRPVARVTDAAQAIAAGERQRRVPVDSERTEAGRLGSAFNTMLDERDASDDLRRRFVADASHELRTPLTSIRGYLDLYGERGFDGASGRDAIRRMTQESARMYELVEDLLLLADLDQQRPLRREPVDVAALARDATLDARALQPERTIELDAPESISVVGDLPRLQQVVAALLSNALAYTDRNALVTVSAWTNGDDAFLGVADTGPGLSDDVAARVFDRFFRAETSRARRAGGSGLGLSIARSIVEAHGGSIALDTGSGRGCNFVVRLPATPEPDDRHADAFATERIHN